MAYDEAYNEPENCEVLITGVEGADPTFVPAYEHAGDAGADLCTSIDFTLAPFHRLLVPTGIRIALPNGYVALVHPRSGLAVKKGISLVNAPGTIDAGYRGEIKVPLINLDPDNSWEFHAGDRIAQLVVQRYVEARFIPAERLPGSDRAERGFGSTGLSGNSSGK
ncbi:MAG: dUTP diphosphatase [Bifidobacteriaceae bacterium]|nr:dUTP diphosphatase [Bifidobacteriaceae bacterium]MCI1914257.1 dUTP diphosphatase [Bifidobacteriaceae bacterium]